MRLTMAAPYDIKNPRSWSGTPLSLYTALDKSGRAEVETVDLSAGHTPWNIKFNAAVYGDIARTLKIRSYVSKLGLSGMNPLNSRLLAKHCKEHPCDALLEFGGFKPSAGLPPYYIYTDTSHDTTLEYVRLFGKMPANLTGATLEDLQRSADYAREIYTKASGVFCMSRWLADSMVSNSGVEPGRVHVVGAGPNLHGAAEPSMPEPRSIEGKGTINLLLVGVDYFLKGMDIAVSAVKHLNKEGTKKYILHIAGIDKSPEDIAEGDSIHFHGFVGKEKLIDLLNGCDLFVMPTRYDCFGIVFLEAMSFGLPCIGRAINAMPELIDDGENGALVSGDDPVKLAELIENICSESAVYARYSALALKKSRCYSWDITADKMLDIIIGS